MEKNIALSEQLLNDLVAYLVRRPYMEVADLLGRLQTEAQESLPPGGGAPE